jgi:predicted AlkP superfamily phosphohydrolase/phosphomutase
MTIGKVFVIGLDGATFDLIEPLLAAGELPNIAALLDSGCYGRLQSSNPDLSPPAWTSFMTGKHPGKHAILDFFCQKKQSYDIEFLNASYRRGKTIFQLLTEADKLVCIVNVPFTYPPERVKGVMISGMDTPSIESDFIYPPSLRQELEAGIGPYLLERPERNIHDDHVADYLNNIFQVTENRFAAADYLIDKQPWDLFMVVFESTDRVQHTMWKYFDQQHPEYTAENNARFGSALYDTYRDLDVKIGKLREKIPADGTILLLSDHGFGPLYKGVRMEKWLADNAFLVSTRRIKPRITGVIKEKIRRVLPVFLKVILKDLLPPKVILNNALDLTHLDMSKTKVFTIGGYGQLIINLQGRQPDGIVEPGREYEELCGQLIERLQELRDPDTGEKIVEDVQMRDEIYSEYQENTPDIIIRWARGYYHIGEKELQFLGIRVRNDQLFTPHRWSGNHRPDGIFVASGLNIRHAGDIQGARIIDLAPSILALLGVGVPRDMDGRALSAIISEDFLAAHEICYCEAADSDDRPEKVYSAEEREKVSERLRDLGYLE